MSVSAVIFDFDGVIADTERLHLGAFQEVFATRGWTLGEAAYFDRYLGCDDRGLVVAYAEDERLTLAPAEIDELVGAKTRAFSRHLSSVDVIFAGARRTIESLAARYPLAIASGALHREIDAILSVAGLSAFFPVIVGADDVTRHKPSPEPYLAAADRLGVVPASCVAIEDSAAGLMAAVAAGMRTIAVSTTSPASALSVANRVVGMIDEITVELVESLA